MELIKRRFVIGAAGLAVLGAGGVAWAAGGGDAKREREAFLNDAADRLNVSPDELREALQGAFFERLDAAVKDGRLTQARADEIKEHIRDSGGLPLGPGLGPRFGHRHEGGPGFLRAGFEAAAGYLDLSRAQLRERLFDGDSLADVARDRNKSVDGLKDAIEDAVRKELDEAVDDKELTDPQRDRILEALDERIDHIVNRDGPRPGRHRFRGGWGPPPGGP